MPARTSSRYLCMILLSAAVFKHILQVFTLVARDGLRAPGRVLSRTVQPALSPQTHPLLWAPEVYGLGLLM